MTIRIIEHPLLLEHELNQAHNFVNETAFMCKLELYLSCSGENLCNLTKTC